MLKCYKKVEPEDTLIQLTESLNYLVLEVVDLTGKRVSCGELLRIHKESKTLYLTEGIDPALGFNTDADGKLRVKTL